MTTQNQLNVMNKPFNLNNCELCDDVIHNNTVCQWEGEGDLFCTACASDFEDGVEQVKDYR